MPSIPENLSPLDRRDVTPLPRSFYAPSARTVAPALLGNWLLRKTANGVAGGPIVETEAYLKDDPACHAARGQTERNREMFGPPGRAYVYLIYGLHYCVNAVCCPEGIGEAVLIRAIEPQFGLSWISKQRPVKEHLHLTNGPAKLCQALAIDRSFDGADLCANDSELLICMNPDRANFISAREPMITTTRIGITQAAHLPLRHYLEKSPFVSTRVKVGRPSR